MKLIKIVTTGCVWYVPVDKIIGWRITTAAFGQPDRVKLYLGLSEGIDVESTPELLGQLQSQFELVGATRQPPAKKKAASKQLLLDTE